jgi:RND family efflux transporter MFP subunit
MKNIYISLAMLFLFSCGANQSHSIETEEQEEVKIEYLEKGKNYELFAEADPFLVNKEAEVLAHFTSEDNFKALLNAKASIVLKQNGQEILRQSKELLRAGIYKFQITPTKTGKFSMEFYIEKTDGKDTVIVNQVEVFNDEQKAIEHAESLSTESNNDIVFLKEQSWYMPFELTKAEKKMFNKIIRTSGKILPSPKNEFSIVAQASGVVNLTDVLVLGKRMKVGDSMLRIKGALIENNFSVKQKKLKSDFENSKRELDRVEALFNQKIVSQKRFNDVKNQFNKIKAEYDLFFSNRQGADINVLSPYNGVVSNIYVKNGQYVKAGELLAKISLSKTVLLQVNLSKEYIGKIDEINSANFKLEYSNNLYSTDKIGGQRIYNEISSNDNSPYIPIYFRLPYNKELVNYSFSEVYLKLNDGAEKIAIAKDAIIESENNFWVYVQSGGERFLKKDVVVNEGDGEKMVISNGINDGDYVVTKGAFAVKQASMSGSIPEHSH